MRILADLIRKNEYTQSANTLFHFMKEEAYLVSSLENRILFPRYCKENIEYLGLQVEDKLVQNISILQKCFCDIPLHQVATTFLLKQVAGGMTGVSSADQYTYQPYTHPDFYGEYAIAFSKAWAVKNNLQPVHYVNSESSFVAEFRTAFHCIYGLESIEDVLVDDFINRLTFLKPLQGPLIRKENNQEVTYIKNFHDEREWRFVPPLKELSKADLERVIYKDIIQKELDLINTRIAKDNYSGIGLRYGYNDIRYLIVPGNDARDRIISNIMNLPIALFDDCNNKEKQKLTLISKILMLEEIKEDS